MRKAYLVPALVLALGISCWVLPSPASAQVAVGISVRFGPPALPVYAQPICPGPDYIWAPGYWAYGPDGYYWVPGTWVLAPEPGLLWTPGWWGYDADGDDYVWHPGYWGPHVGFYGGINYGFGYFGTGFVGGEWRDRHFYYNRAVTNVNVTEVHNVYVNRTVVNNVYVNNHVSYNGGPDGIDRRPTANEDRWDRERHFEPTAEQQQHVMQARDNRQLHYSDNHGRPPIAATQRPTQFSGPGVEHPGSRDNEFHPPANQNRQHENYQPQPNNSRPENRHYNPPPSNNHQPQNRNYNPPPNQGRPGGEPGYQPHGNHNEAQPHNEQPRGNQGGDRGGHGNDEHKGGGRDDGHR